MKSNVNFVLRAKSALKSTLSAILKHNHITLDTQRVIQDIPMHSRHVGLRHIIPNPRVILNLFDYFCRNLLISCKMSGFPQNLTDGFGFLFIADICNKDTVPSMTPVKNNHSPKTSLFNGPFIQISSISRKSMAFSLVELLMALLVASLLLAALAPVMTKKFGENVNITGNMTPAGTIKKTIELDFNSEECSDIKTDSDGSVYCEGEFEVPGGYNGYMNVTVIGAGGGGGTAPTAGYTEYTTIGDHTFTVPAIVGKIETTLVSGGAGGGAGGQINKTQTFVTYGNGNITADANNIVTVDTDGTGTWTIPEAIRNKQILASACGGGGGGGASSGNIAAGTDGRSNPDAYGYGGGTGGYVLNQLTNFGNADKLTYYIGGGGGGASTGAGSYNGLYAYNEGLPYGGATIPFSDNGVAVSGALITSSTKGGAGGIGIVGTCTSASNWTIQAYVNGGDGGSPNGGRGAQIHANPCYGGGGGGGGAASQLVIGSGIYLNAPGGGGGGGSELIGSWNTCGKAAGGGGGGGAGGGNGGSYNSHEGKSGSGGANASGITGGSITTIFGSNYCNGGNGGEYKSNGTVNTAGRQGKSGAIRLTYIDYGPGGSGGGGGAIVPIQPVKTTPGETLGVHIGKGGLGGVAGYLDTVNKKIISPDSTGADHFGQESNLTRNGNRLLRTNDGNYWSAHYGCADGTILNSHFGCGQRGSMTHGLISRADLSTPSISMPGFLSTRGRTAGGNSDTDAENQAKWGDKTFAPKTEGGNGGDVTLFNGEITCERGKGGTQSSPNGKNGSGYGCGGGGGWTMGNGGNGSGGYARISWNKYWDTATNAYKNAGLGAGGGGASGNIFTYSIPVKSNQIIKYRIGKGGSGAYISNNTLTNAANGGATIFGDIKAGGGGAGNSVSIDTSHDNALINGIGGNVSNICHFGSTSYLNNKKCTKGTAGSNAVNLTGGNGANFIGFKYIVYTKEGDNESKTEKTVSGTGGTGGVLDTGDNANGKDVSGFASGGGGAALRDIGQVNSSSAGNITNNPNRGGKGGDGKIIIEWWE